MISLRKNLKQLERELEISKKETARCQKELQDVAHANVHAVELMEQLETARDQLNDQNQKLRKNEKNIQQQRTALQESNSQLKEEMQTRIQAQQELIEYKDHLEALVQQRTEELQQSILELDQIFAVTGSGMRMLDLDFNVLRVNQAFVEMTKYSEETLLKNKCFGCFAGPQCHTEECVLTRIKKTKEPVVSESLKTAADGSLIPCILNASPFVDAQGEITGIVECFIDISKQKAAEDDTKRLKLYLQNIINSMPSSIIGVNDQAHVTLWNIAAEKNAVDKSLIAYDEKIEAIYPDMAPHLPEIHRAIAEKRVINLPRRLTAHEQTVRYENIVIFPLLAEGEIGAVIRIDDVTEAEKKNDLLRQAQKMETVGTLAGGLAHDFNNVLSGIVGANGLLQLMLESDKQDKKEMLSLIEMSERSAQRATTMVQQLMTLSRKNKPSVAPVDINSTIRHIQKFCTNTFEKCITILIEPHPEPAVTEADPAQLEQVILNLCINASHAMTIMRSEEDVRGGILRLCIKHITCDTHFRTAHPEAVAPSYWLLSISDTGIGMAPKTLSKIFDPFFTTKKQGEGTGLGLAMAYNIIQQGGGFIDVYSELGVGSTFNLFLPVSKTSELPEPLTRYTSLPKGSGLILVVDDEEMIRTLASSMLRECGYEVLCATNGQEAVELFEEHHCEIRAVLMDMAMPIMSGEEAYHLMKKIDPNLTVLLASGFRQDERVEKMLNAGINDFLQKPYTMDLLAKKIHRALS